MSPDLLDDFRVQQVALRLWGKVPEQSYLPELAATSQELREYAAALGEPYCGTQAPFESRDWFDSNATLGSFAFLPLRTVHTFGLLALEATRPGVSTPGWARSTSRAWPSLPASRRRASSRNPDADGCRAPRGREYALER